MREVQDLVLGSDPPPEVLADVVALLGRVSGLLRPWPTDAGMTVTDQWGESVRRSENRTFSPAFVVDQKGDGAVKGHVTFTRFYLGGAGAVHGGAIMVLFDIVLGSLANDGQSGRARTGYLKVDFRKITPLNQEVQVVGRLERREGRKIFTSGQLLLGDQVLAEADGLFITLLPGQQ